MKHVGFILFLLFSFGTSNLSAAPVFSRMKLCKIAAQKNVQQDIEKFTKKTPLRYLRLTDGCQHTKSLYVALTPSGGPFSGHNIEMVVMDGKIFQRFRLCDDCPFSPWRHIDDHPYSNKRHKDRGFDVCPDGTIEYPQENSTK